MLPTRMARRAVGAHKPNVLPDPGQDKTGSTALEELTNLAVANRYRVFSEVGDKDPPSAGGITA